MIVDKKLEINDKKKIEIEVQLEKHKFPKIENSYNYLLSMPIYNLTREKIEELKKQEEEKQADFDVLVEKTPQKIWLEDLSELESVYDKWIENKHSKNVENKKKQKISTKSK
jgi:DNA topoisomerase-2